ncbi:MAG: hypothetical protein BJ554DRAFT_3542, partial [Olpidium bornovanus]
WATGSTRRRLLAALLLLLLRLLLVRLRLLHLLLRRARAAGRRSGRGPGEEEEEEEEEEEDTPRSITHREPEEIGTIGPRIAFVNPATLLPHEDADPERVRRLADHLRDVPPSTQIPLPVTTSTFPRVILDGHHRVAACVALGIALVPVWEVDERHEDADWENCHVRVYRRDDGSRCRLVDVVGAARRGKVDWGVKGPRHVAVTWLKGKKELDLETVAPR